MNQNYIGITGVKTLSQTKAVFKKFKYYNLLDNQFSHFGMIGYLVNYQFKTEDYALESKKKPTLEELYNNLIYLFNKPIFKTIHYYTENNQAFSKEITELLKLPIAIPLKQQREFSANSIDLRERLVNLNNLIGGIQLNIESPNPLEILKIRKRFPGLKIIFQFRRKYHKNFNLKNFVRKYQVFDYILFDQSLGFGAEINLDKNQEIYRKVFNNGLHSNYNVGFAGGLNESNIYKKIKKIYKLLGNINFSIDTQSGVRNPEDKLEINKINNFLSEFIKSILDIRINLEKIPGEKKKWLK